MSGLLMFFICWSGTFATLSHELDWLANPAQRVTPEGDQIGFAAAHDAVYAAMPEARITGLTPPRYANFAAEALVRTPESQTLRVFVDPYTAEVTGSASFFNIQRFFRSLHYNFFNLGGVGLFIVAFFGLPLIASLVTGLFFYKRWWRRFFELKTGSGARAFWSSAHKVAGLWSLWFVVIIGVTSVWYLFEHARYKMGDGHVAYVGTGDFAANELPQAGAAETSLDLESLLAGARAERPTLNIRTVRPDNGGYFYVDGQDGDLLVRHRANNLYLNRETGAVIHDQHASDLNAYWRWSDMADPLHFGDFGGLASKLIWFVFGLLLSGLSLTGAWLHVKRIERDRFGRAQWRGTLAAIAVSGAVVIGTVWSGFAELRAYGPLIDGVRHWPEVSFGVSVVIVGWTALTLAILVVWTAMLVRSLRKARSQANALQKITS